LVFATIGGEERERRRKVRTGEEKRGGRELGIGRAGGSVACSLHPGVFLKRRGPLPHYTTPSHIHNIISD